MQSSTHKILSPLILQIRPLPVALCCLFCLLLAKASHAQTTGAGYISSIEDKAKTILRLENEIEALKQKMKDLSIQKQQSIDDANKRLNDAIELTKTETSWKNRLKTAKDGWEEYSPGTCGAGGPPPICQVNHWFKTSLSEAMAKYNQYLENFLWPYKEAVKNAGKEEEKERYKAAEKIDANIVRSAELRKEIISLSKQYEDHIKEQARNRAKSYGMELVQIVSEIHYQDDLVTEYNHLITENNKQESIKKEEAKTKVKSDIDRLKKKLDNDLQQLEKTYEREAANREATIQQHNTTIADLKNRVRGLEEQIHNFKGPESQKLVYEDQKNNLLKSVYAEENKIQALMAEIKQLKDLLFDETNTIRTELLKLSSDEGSKIAEAMKLVEAAFAAKREMLQKSLNQAETRKAELTNRYRTRLDEKHKAFVAWTNLVDAERIRLMAACQSVSCTCYGTYVVNECNMIWSTFKDCVNSIDRMKYSAGAVLYDKCVDLKNYYDSLYKGYQGSNNSSQQSEVDRQKAKNRFENIMEN